MRAPDLEFTPALGSRILGAVGLDGPAHSVAPLPGGEVNPVFLLDGPAGRCVAWVNRRDPDRPKVAKQAWAYGALRAAGLPAPEVLGIDLTRTVLPYDYLVMRYVPGDRVADVAAAAPADLRRGLGRAAGRLLADLHRMDLAGRLPPGAPPWGDPFDAGRGGESWGEVITRWAEDLVAAAAAGLDPGQARAITEAAREQAGAGAAGLPERPCLVHRDFQGSNLIMGRDPAPPDRSGRFTALLDFEWAMLADPRLEFGALDQDGVASLGDPDAFWAAYRDAIPEGPADAPAIAVYRLLYAVEILGVVLRGGVPGDPAAARRRVGRRLAALG